MDQNGSNWIKMDQNGSKWIKMDQMDQKRLKGIKSNKKGSIASLGSLSF